MKILGLSFSPRKDGNTVVLLNQALNGAKEEGAETELYSIAGKDIRPCDGCWGCRKAGECHIKDDMQEIYTELLEADGIIFGTPVYFYNMTGPGKGVIDRTIALGGRLANKVGGIVAVAGSFGLVDAVKDLYFYMITRRMLPASFIAAYAGGKGDVKDLEKCMQATHDLGKEMVKIAASGFKYPEGGTHIAYGTHTK
ncbi:MAG: flavodoxin family protein [Dehalococcoidales bacterium]|nr:flavodoxin family protein [Dehalococcoidales bacterium]